MELTLDCGVCGVSANVEGIESAPIAQGLLDAWCGNHRHSADDLKQYHDAEIAVEEYRHSHPYGGDAEDD